ncbi:MAG: MBL fold metallo-hydrolase [Acidobacteria bacterium]|nr:MBL fold metallo-hydrolase [Acidobacteriota bacterium]
MRFGSYTVRALLDSRFALDGGSMFGVVPRALWQKVVEPDSQNRIPLVSRLLYVEGEGRRILVDTGLGDKWDDKRRAMFAIDLVEGGAAAQLRNFGVEPDDITDVVLTHLALRSRRRDHVHGC